MRHIPRIAQLMLAALAGAAVCGGGYALASSGGGRTIHACVTRHTHELLIQRRCTRHESSLRWNARGPTGRTGRTGPAGPAGPQAVGAWGLIGENPSGAGVNAGQNLAVTRTGVGTVSVTVIGGPCANQLDATVVTPNTTSPPGPDIPVAYTTGTPGATTFTLHLGTLQSGTFTPQDAIVAASVVVYCNP